MATAMADFIMSPTSDSISTTIFGFLIALIWACLATPVYPNPAFKHVFSTYAILSALAITAGLSFCPGLLDALQAAAPPSSDFFLTLPGPGLKVWGVYAIVFPKDGCIDLVYIGSGTEAKSGVRDRLANYDNGTKLPLLVQAALDDKYEIASKGLLVWCPIPAVANRPTLRVLFLVIEAALTFAFWAVHSTKTNHSMISCCRWPLSSFTYGGLCTHSPLTESVPTELLDLTAEQLEAIDAAQRENTRIYHKEYRYRPHIYAHLRAQGRIIDRRFRKNNLERVKANSNRNDEIRRGKKNHYCSTCGVSCSKATELVKHNLSKRHLKKVADAKAGITNTMPFHCATCNISYPTKKQMVRHESTGRHLKWTARPT